MIVIEEENLELEERLNDISGIELLNNRATTHGSFSESAELEFGIMKLLNADLDKSYKKTPHKVKQAIVQKVFGNIVSKICRIIHGDQLTQDHYDDIIGYTTLLQKETILVKLAINEEIIGNERARKSS